MRPAQLTPENNHAPDGPDVGLARFNEAGAINAGKPLSALADALTAVLLQ